MGSELFLYEAGKAQRKTHYLSLWGLSVDIIGFFYLYIIVILIFFDTLFVTNLSENLKYELLKKNHFDVTSV